ncbi:MAG: DUF2490 domain-containing protein [Halieaceae bacterium]|jgi:hypothetical protein|nr:DUF2490 domain-containing protein [Halieaceae bacterium]
MNRARPLLIALLLLSPVANCAEFFTGLFPEAAITRRLENGRSLTFKVEHQQIAYDRDDDPRGQFTRYRTDWMAFYGAKISPSNSVAVGVFHRIQGGENANRFIQQFASVMRLRRMRLAHRVRTDQTFTDGEDVELRLRYRLAAELPLSGTSLEPGENYLMVSNEPIFSLQSGDFEIENRLVLGVGRLLSRDQKLEVSIDHRTDKYIQDGFRHRLWLKVGYFMSF